MSKQQLIMDNALELFAEKGIKHTSIQQITDRCNMSKGAFYLVFKSKDELITALIDRFMMQYISDIDYIVTHLEQETVLDHLLTYSFEFFLKHDDFSNVFMKEQIHKVNDTLIQKMRDYDEQINKVLYQLVKQLYDEKSEAETVELVYIIKAFVQMYQFILLRFKIRPDINLFVRSLIDKIDVIAQYSQLSFITDDMMIEMSVDKKKIDSQQLIDKIDHIIIEINDDIVIESLQLLKKHLINEPLQLAVIQGLLHNIHKHPLCKEISYLYNFYIKDNKCEL